MGLRFALICPLVVTPLMLIPMIVISQDYRTQDSMPPEAETAVLVLPTSLNHEVYHRKYATGDKEDPFKIQRRLIRYIFKQEKCLLHSQVNYSQRKCHSDHMAIMYVIDPAVA